MAVREFNGTSDRIVVDDGIIGQLANGAFTLFLLLRWLGTVGSGKQPLSVQDGASQVVGLMDNEQNPAPGIRLAIADGNEFIDSSATNVITDDLWCLTAVTCTAPGATPRFHGKTRGSGSWVHVNGDTTFTGNTVDATQVEFGSFNNGAFTSFWNGRLAVAAVWTSALSDGDIESIETTPATQTVYDLSPTSLWDFNQANVADDVIDLMGNGADETTISGTTVIEGDDPSGWTFGVENGAGAGWVTTL